MQYSLIYNPNSGSCSDKAIDAIEQAFLDSGESVELVDLSTCDLRTTVESLAKKGRVIIAAGGDGTISAVAAEVIRTNATMAVLPMGTLNHFAKDLGIPQRLEEAVEVILAGEQRLVDVGSMNDSIFINNSSIGLYPRVVALRERLQKGGHSKWVAAILASAKLFFRIPKLHVNLIANGEIVKRTTSLVFVGNNAYKFNGLQMGSRDAIDHGELSVVILSPTTGFKLMLLVVKDLAGHKPHPKEMEVFKTSEVNIKLAHRSIRVAADGEVFLTQAPLHYKIIPKALRILAPTESEA